MLCLSGFLASNPQPYLFLLPIVHGISPVNISDSLAILIANNSDLIGLDVEGLVPTPDAAPNLACAIAYHASLKAILYD